MTTPLENNPLPRELGPGLILRRSTRADGPALAEFNGLVHREEGEAAFDVKLAEWTLDLMERPHPTFDPGDFTLVEDAGTGRIVSASCLISQNWSYGGVPFGVGRPELVGTLPEYRRRGLIRAQMEELHRWSAERGQPVQAITGIPFFYRQFGYEMALNLQGGRAAFEANIRPLPAGLAEPYVLRAATLDDLGFLAEVYDAAAACQPVACLRDAALWRYELAGKRPQNLERRVVWLIESQSGEPVGFVSHFPWLVNREALVVNYYALKPGVSWLAATPSVLRALWAVGQGYAARGEGAMRNLTLLLGSEHPAYEAAAGWLPHGWPPYAWYLRVPDLPGFVGRVAPALEQRLARSIAAGHSGELRFSFYTGGLRLVLQAGRLAAVEPWQPDDTLDGSAAFPGQSFLQLLFGYRSLAELRQALPDCRCAGDEPRVLLNALFPKQASHVWPIN
jgi:hypothetical protein